MVDGNAIGAMGKQDCICKLASYCGQVLSKLSFTVIIVTTFYQ